MKIIKNIIIFPSRNKRFAVPELRTSASNISSSSVIYLLSLAALGKSISQSKDRLRVFQNRVLTEGGGSVRKLLAVVECDSSYISLFAQYN
jgi:hypothetical protein